MNPEAPFDYYLFKKKSRIKLAYEKEFFRKQENFVYYYDQIKFLLEQPDLVIFGYSISNDIRYLHDACNRYNLPLILFNGYDAQELLNILKKHDQSIGLEKAITDFNIDLSHQIAHRSDEDAFKTMRIVQEMCNLMEMDVKQLIEIADLKALSSIQEQKRKLFLPTKTKVSKKPRILNGYYNQEIENAFEMKLQRDTFSIAQDLQKNEETLLETLELIYNNGGIVKNKLNESKYILTANDDTRLVLATIIDSSRIIILTLAELYDLLK